MKGDPWFTTITTQLDESRVGVVFITPSNADEPWLNFESGALLTKFGKQRVCPVLIGLSKSEYAGPLKNLQLTELEDEVDTFDLVKTINLEVDRPLNEDVLRSAFDAQWPTLNKAIAEAKIGQSKTPKPKRSMDDKVDELLESVRELARVQRQSLPLATDYSTLAGPDYRFLSARNSTLGQYRSWAPDRDRSHTLAQQRTLIEYLTRWIASLEEPDPSSSGHEGGAPDPEADPKSS